MVLFDGNMQTSYTPCKTLNQSWTSMYPDNITLSESPQPPFPFSSSFFVPLYSDWNSALATWGFAWEAHIYGLGSVFAAFGLISVVCLLGLPLRCPSGIPYFIVLHIFLAAFAGIQAFSLIYDAYSHQDRLSPLFSLLLVELQLPCLIAAFSLAIVLLSLRSRMYLPMQCLFLPKPCLMLCMSLLHFAASLGCVGILELFPSLPTLILLLPQAMFVCLAIILSWSYLLFYCLIKGNTKHVYRLNDSGESGGSPELIKEAKCPFANIEDWERAAGAGVGASACLLGCGGLQVYGILHTLGLGGVEGYGFHPWPWWGFHMGCRLCEVGVCLGLSLIGTHPLFCPNKTSIQSLRHSKPGSWSRLSCSLPSQGLTLPSHGAENSPVVSTHNSWNKLGKVDSCEVTSKRQSEALPLFSMVDSPENGLDCVAKNNQNQTTILPLPAPTSPPHKLLNPVQSQRSSQESLPLDTDSTIDLRPPTPINLSRSIDQALFSESIFSPSVFGMPRMLYTSSSQSLSSQGQEKARQGLSQVEGALYRTSSCGDVDQEKVLSSARPSHPHSSLTPQIRPQTSPVEWDWKGSISGSTQGLCRNPKETKKLRSHSWANRGQNFAQSSIPRAIPHLTHNRRYRTLSLASQDSRRSCRLAETKHLSESKQLEWDLAVQAEFVSVCKQIDAFSVCSDTIEL